MNVVGKFSLGLTAALVLNLGVRAAPAVPPPVLPVAADAATARDFLEQYLNGKLQ